MQFSKLSNECIPFSMRSQAGSYLDMIQLGQNLDKI